MKARLLQTIDEGREVESELAALVIDAPANPDGRWTAKDHLAHVSWWRRRSADTLNAVRTGSEMPPVLDDDDAVNNAVIYAEIKDRGAADVKGEAEQSWSALRAAVEASSEEDLAKPHPRFPGFQLWESVPSAVGHAGTHVWSWYLDMGDEERGMKAARWTADIEGRFFDTPDKLADSRYNLACVYARLGRADEALPLLRQSFEAKPELAELARKDRDLDRIREELAPILS